MTQESTIPRRTFLTKLLAFGLGIASATIGILAISTGKKIDPFLSRKSLAVLKRFGSGRKLVDALELTEVERRRLADRIADIRREFDRQTTAFFPGDFTQRLRTTVEADFKQNKVVVANGWVLSEAEVGIYLFNQMHRAGVII